MPNAVLLRDCGPMLANFCDNVFPLNIRHFALFPQFAPLSGVMTSRRETLKFLDSWRKQAIYNA